MVELRVAKPAVEPEGPKPARPMSGPSGGEFCQHRFSATFRLAETVRNQAAAPGLRLGGGQGIAVRDPPLGRLAG